MAEAGLRLIHGEEQLLVEQAVERWLQRARAAATDVEVIEGTTDLAPLRQSLAEVPLFDPQHYILLRNPPQLTGKRSATELMQALDLQADTTFVCITARATLPPSNPMVEKAKRDGAVEHYPAFRGKELRNWLGEELHRRGLRLPPGGGEHLLRTCQSAGEISQELDKLVAYGEKNISLTELRSLSAASEQLEVWSVFERLLGDSPGSGAAALTDLLQQGRPSQLVLAVLAGQVREIVMAQALSARGLRAADVAKEMKIAPWRAERLLRYTRRISAAVAQEWLLQLQRIDAGIKQGQAIDRDALTLFGLRAAAAVQGRI